MRWGIFGARADERGLGHVTREAFLHLQPDRCAVIDMGEWAHGWAQDFTPYGGDAMRVAYNGGRLDTDAMRRFFTGLDVAYMVETPYDHRAYEVAWSVGCRTVLHVMPELFPHDKPKPDVCWLPTSWQAEWFPGARRVPVPVAVEHFSMRAIPPSSPLRVVHVGGKRAARDRNGTEALYAALPFIRQRVHLTIVSQEPSLPHPELPVRSGVTVRLIAGGLPNYWDFTEGQHALVLPRRYGGLSLPVAQAMAGGLAVIMPDLAPQNTDWPVLTVPAHRAGAFRAPAGPIPVHDVNPSDLAGVIDSLADPLTLSRFQEAGLAWAAGNSWEALAPLYRSELEHAAGLT